MRQQRSNFVGVPSNAGFRRLDGKQIAKFPRWQTAPRAAGHSVRPVMGRSETVEFACEID
jgi:hypothetical protein